MNHRKSAPQALTIVGPGRVGSSIAAAARKAGLQVDLAGRELTAAQVDAQVVLLCVPDSAIDEVATRIRSLEGPPRMLGHASGATSLDPLSGEQGEPVFSIHPLQTVPDGQTSLTGCPAAIAGSTGDAVAMASGLAEVIGMLPFEVAESDRAAYHAAASIASNYLVTLEQVAAGMLERIGVENPRSVLAPLVRQSLSNWEQLGAGALTGPIARGDLGTVEQHRTAIMANDPELLEMYDVMAERTRAMAAAPNGAPAA